MSDEQRAHDIALQTTNILYKFAITNALKEHTDATFDYYQEYKKAYEHVLESIKRDFN